MKNKHIGSTLQSLFDELGEGEEFRLLAQKKAFVIAAEQRMAALKMSKNALSKRMGTSRPAIDVIGCVPASVPSDAQSCEK